MLSSLGGLGCCRLSYPYDALTKEELVSLIGILKKSKYMKNPISQRGKARAQLPHGKGKRKHKYAKASISSEILDIEAFCFPTLPDRCSFRNFGLNLFYEHLSIRCGGRF